MIKVTFSSSFNDLNPSAASEDTVKKPRNPLSEPSRSLLGCLTVKKYSAC